MKKLFSLLLVFALSITCFSFTTSAADVSDYSVSLSFPSQAEAGETIDVTVTVTNITAFEGTGILSASVYLFYDSNIFTPVENSFEGTAPSGWDTFDGTATVGAWNLYTVFDGNFENTASKDGDISFKVSFSISKTIDPQDTYFTISGCEGTEYNSSALLKIKSFESTAYCKETFSITAPRILIPHDENTFDIDRENGMIYSETASLDYDSFSALFSHIGGTLTITAFDYEITSENGKYIPNGAEISVYHILTEQTYTFKYYLLGDCDCNGVVNVTDLACVKTVIKEKLPVEGHVLYSMEFEQDGVVRIADYLRLKRYITAK